MKKILLFILLFSIGTSAQFNRFGFGKSEYFNVSVSIDPMGSIDTETPNFTTEIELVENAFYVKTGIQVTLLKSVHFFNNVLVYPYVILIFV